MSLMSPKLQAGSVPLGPPGNPLRSLLASKSKQSPVQGRQNAHRFHGNWELTFLTVTFSQQTLTLADPHAEERPLAHRRKGGKKEDGNIFQSRTSDGSQQLLGTSPLRSGFREPSCSVS